MKVVAAPNAFKESLSARGAAEAIARGVVRALPGCEVVQLPVADGGDGTREVLVRAAGGEERTCDVQDPLGRPIRACYGLIEGGRTAVVDVAAASGLALLAVGERDPLRASSFGTGQLLRHALSGGAKRVLLGVGGSATVDAGLGLVAALGAAWRDARGDVLEPCGAALTSVASVDFEPAARLLAGRELIVLADVDNPLLGATGAAPVFAPQKGADAAAVSALARGLERLTAVLARQTGHDVATMPRGGAAGGIAATLFALGGARVVSGIDHVLDLIGFDIACTGAELVITAEGRLDAQSAFNKGPSGVARRARGVGVPTIVLAGAIADDLEHPSEAFAAALPIQRRPVDLETAKGRAAEWLEATARQVMLVYGLGMRSPR